MEQLDAEILCCPVCGDLQTWQDIKADVNPECVASVFLALITWLPSLPLSSSTFRPQAGHLFSYLEFKLMRHSI
jgi:hypothetical protein